MQGRASELSGAVGKVAEMLQTREELEKEQAQEMDRDLAEDFFEYLKCGDWLRCRHIAKHFQDVDLETVAGFWLKSNP